MRPKLSYFNMTGLGEPVRFMLAYGNIDFEDNRVTKEEWAEMKNNLKFIAPQLPRLIIDGETLHQSRAICRYLAKKLNLTGKDDLEAAHCDMIIDAIDDLRSKVVNGYYMPDGETRNVELETSRTKTVPQFLAKLETHVKENNGFLITWADVMFAAYMDYISFMVGPNILNNFPLLKKICEKVTSQSGLAKYIKNRPNDTPDYRKIFT